MLTAFIITVVIFFIIILLLIAKLSEAKPSVFNTFYGKPPGENQEEEVPLQMQWEFPEELVKDANLVADEVPVFIQTEHSSAHVGSAVIFEDQGTYNGLIEIFEKDTDYVRKMIDPGLNGISIAVLPPEEPSVIDEFGEEVKNG